MRRFAMIITSLLTTVVALVSGATAAFAANTATSGGGGSSAAQLSHSAGLAVWQISLIVAAGIVLVLTVSSLVRRTSRRFSVRHAIH
jgi:hypothetical protein